MDVSPPKKKCKNNNTTQIEENPTHWASPKNKIVTLHNLQETKQNNKQKTTNNHILHHPFPFHQLLKVEALGLLLNAERPQEHRPFTGGRGKTHSRRRAKKEALEPGRGRGVDARQKTKRWCQGIGRRRLGHVQQAARTPASFFRCDDACSQGSPCCCSLPPSVPACVSFILHIYLPSGMPLPVMFFTHFLQ